MEYLELKLAISPREPYAEILTYHLSEIGFDMFEDTLDGLKAYILEQNYDENNLLQLLKEQSNSSYTVQHEVTHIPWKNWNEEWESNFQPELIAEKIYVRAEFHPSNPDYNHELVIQPRMAFGTGHHPTTAQVMELMLSIDFKNKSVLDMGSGTGILALLALQLGAKSALAVDNDDNAVDNSRENAIRNNLPQMEALVGESSTIADRKFEIILANINRNIILNDLPFYAEMLFGNGVLVTSGYYEQDLKIIRDKASSLGLNYVKHIVKNNWCCAEFIKQ